jgi:hypothetical protein
MWLSDDDRRIVVQLKVTFASIADSLPDDVDLESAP